MVKNGMQNLYFQKEEYNNLDDNEVITKIKQGDKKALNYLLELSTCCCCWSCIYSCRRNII